MDTRLGFIGVKDALAKTFKLVIIGRKIFFTNFIVLAISWFLFLEYMLPHFNNNITIENLSEYCKLLDVRLYKYNLIDYILCFIAVAIMTRDITIQATQYYDINHFIKAKRLSWVLELIKNIFSINSQKLKRLSIVFFLILIFWLSDKLVSLYFGPIIQMLALMSLVLLIVFMDAIFKIGAKVFLEKIGSSIKELSSPIQIYKILFRLINFSFNIILFVTMLMMLGIFIRCTARYYIDNIFLKSIICATASVYLTILISTSKYILKQYHATFKFVPTVKASKLLQN